MCELLALSSQLPTSVTLSLSTFAQHRGADDGWGVAFYDTGDVRLYKEPELDAESEWLAFIQQRSLSASLFISHIRHATRGVRSLPNTQPFSRELGGRVHLFAHNGRFDSIERDYAGGWNRYRPIGETDSEIAFCILLERLAPLWENGSVPALAKRLAVFTQFAADMAAIGPANLLYSDGDALFVHSHRRTQAGGRVAPPGLWRLSRQCEKCRDTAERDQGTSSAVDRRQQEVTLFVSIPLSDEPWVPIAEGEVLAIRHGRLISAVLPGGFRLQDFLFEPLHLCLQFVDKTKAHFPLRLSAQFRHKRLRVPPRPRYTNQSPSTAQPRPAIRLFGVRVSFLISP
jgi:glutamine amidotransferase